MTLRSKLLAVVGAGLALVVASAGADEPEAPAEVEIAPAPAEPAIAPAPAVAELRPTSWESPPFSGAAAREDWQSRRAWGYGTQNLYPLSRGMADAGIPAPARWPLYPFTALFDTGNLLLGAIGGLYGD